MKESDIVVVGGGLVGSLLALMLGRRGHRVRVLERRGDMRRADIVAGRSINLALSDRGWRALEMAGIKEEIQKIALPMRGRRMHDLDGELSFLPYHEDGRCIFSVSRAGLNIALMNASERHEKVDFFFDKRVEKLDLAARTVFLDDGTCEQADVILGTDGAFSAVRLSMMLSPLRLNYQQDYLAHGYKELLIPAAPDGSFRIDDDCLHIWPREKFMLIALPNPGGDFTVTLFLDYGTFAKLDSDEKVRAFFDENFADVVPHMPTLLDDFRNNPIGELCTVRCSPWNYEDKACLLGDAAHAIVPFYGQGMNAGFEDCTVFSEMLDEDTADDWGSLFNRFSEARKPNADAIADLAIYNFIEMRDRVADPSFLLRKKIEAKISKRYGAKYEPLYSMVTFSHRPYREAQQLGEAHEAMMQSVMSTPKIEELWDSDEVMARVDAALERRGIRR